VAFPGVDVQQGEERRVSTAYDIGDFRFLQVRPALLKPQQHLEPFIFVQYVPRRPDIGRPGGQFGPEAGVLFKELLVQELRRIQPLNGLDPAVYGGSQGHQHPPGQSLAGLHPARARCAPQRHGQRQDDQQRSQRDHFAAIGHRTTSPPSSRTLPRRGPFRPVYPLR
jgi:hypothetical protein